MHRSGYDQIPNRINPPNPPIIDVPRAGRTLLGAPPRQPLLGDAPVDRHGYYRSSNSYSSAPYNGTSFDVSRRRGFDKGPQGEDLNMRPARQPLLKTPMAVEHIGGDMDISRSRSPSPEYRLVNVAARNVRDDRKKDRDRSRRSRSRSRRSRTRSRSRSRERGRDRANGRERGQDRYSYEAPRVEVRAGVLWTSENYYDFLKLFLELLNREMQKGLNRDAHGVRQLYEVVTAATDAEKTQLVLPPDLRQSDRERMLHCDTSIEGLPASIFYGSGYGTRQHYAKFSAAKDLIDKCHRIGVINSDLHVAISDSRKIDKAFEHQFYVPISKAVNAVLLLITRMSKEVLPPGFMTLRDLDPDIIDRFKVMLRLVMVDVYYQGIESAVTVVPEALETGRSRSSRGSSASYEDRRGDVKHYSGRNEHFGKSADELLAEKEQEMKLRMEKELEQRRFAMEQEIRRKVQEEERAKIREEVEMEKNIEQLVKQRQEQFLIDQEKTRKEQEEQQKKQLMTQKVEEDFYALVEQLEKQFKSISERGMHNVLDMIYSSQTFKTIQLYSSTMTSMTFDQKNQLVIDLRSLLGSIAKATQALSSIPVQSVPAPVQVPSVVQIPNYQPPASSRTNQQAGILTVGNLRLRLLSESEKKRLSKGDKVITQDSKNGHWNLSVVDRVGESRVTVTVGSSQWKKQWNELYIEDSKSSRY